MDIKNYEDLSGLEIDTLKEIGSIGTGNAATALSQLIGKEVRITLPEVRIMKEAKALIDNYIYFYNHERIQLKIGVAPLSLRYSA